MGRNGILPYMLLLPLTILTLLHNCPSLAADRRDTLYLGASLTANQTITSMKEMFKLGFFSPPATNNWYIGIWYAQIPEMTVVWVANRATPIKNMPGFLNLSTDGHLGLFDAEGASLWSINETMNASRAVILDSGNFVILGGYNKSTETTVWQSFDHPVDTWLPGMKFGGKKKLVCWKNSLDPAPGFFSLQMDPSGPKQFVLMWKNSVPYWDTGLWNGQFFSEMPEILQANKSRYNISVEFSSSGIYLTYSMIHTMSALSRFVLHKSGEVRLYSLSDGNKWNMFWSQPRAQCTVYDLCGAYGTCNPNNLQFCSCVEGFKPRDNRAWDSQEWWSSGCVRQRPLNCHATNGSSDEFKGFSVSLPDTPASSFPAKTKKDCEKTCLRNCSCTAFSYTGSCQIWSGDLLNMYVSPSKSISDVFVRVGASAHELAPSSSSKRKTTSIVVAVLGVVVALAITLLFTFLLWQGRRRRRQLRSIQMCADSSNGLLRKFSYKELKIATQNFKYKLGSGGFGSVFKGTLPDNTLVAVKELEGSRQGEKQFRAEISSVGNIQHVNLIRLRGFSAEGSRRLLVYDYMPNGSLNSFLFSSNVTGERKVLDWKTRFEIALGTARGLVYLHEECRERIIHSDVKPENILLDGDFCPKLGDFGLAKLVGRDFSRVLTTTRGTRGYLAPEWIDGIPITPKVDVYSFGMTLLEIISGRKNLDLSVPDPSKLYFPSWVATQIYEGNVMNIVEESIAEEADIEEVRRGGMVSLLCIEHDENARPSMAQVLLMLEGKMKIQKPNSALMKMDQQAHRGNGNSDSDGNGLALPLQISS